MIAGIAPIGRIDPERRTQHDFVTVTGEIGCRIRAASPRSNLRGINFRGRRPSLILLDDVEEDSHLMNATQREQRWDWLNAEIGYLGDETTAMVVMGTIQHPDKYLSKSNLTF